MHGALRRSRQPCANPRYWLMSEHGDAAETGHRAARPASPQPV